MGALLDPKDAEALRERFQEGLTAPVTLRYAVHAGACESCRRTDGILGELAELSPQLELERREGGEHLPAMTLHGAARGRVRFLGLPTGYEFPTLIAALFDVSRGFTELSPEATRKLSALTEPIHLRVFTTPT